MYYEVKIKDLGLLGSNKNFKVFPISDYIKLVTPSTEPFLAQGYNLKNLSKGQLDEATYQIPKALAF